MTDASNLLPGLSPHERARITAASEQILGLIEEARKEAAAEGQTRVETDLAAFGASFAERTRAFTDSHTPRSGTA